LCFGLVEVVILKMLVDISDSVTIQPDAAGSASSDQAARTCAVFWGTPTRIPPFHLFLLGFYACCIIMVEKIFENPKSSTLNI
jgi:hypothetical protein